ncbi:cysteine desulfurase family protein [Natronoglycomyces albus]|uniref:Aminotransferase class V-fold PLP-dependent enzyme n=1 Tax=Natronoglycomyces albus TaxID=2811108 RepID=A0A895XSY6_9ACTN|nr:aminotransferase class V-fold PLP-dependent enzyme [Natronoglycomyces albus]QSB06429.1 aminotransferase class V-fold PLP-dependent enzyme [Natronoglycomyces albus]
MHPTYFDAATAAPIHPTASQAYAAALTDGWADPRRLYSDGRKARMLLDAARESLAESLGVLSDEVVFTHSGTHAVHSGSLGVLRARPQRDLFAHSAVEHSSVLHAAAWHSQSGGSVAQIGVDRYGRVDVDELSSSVPKAALVAVQSVNHEVGTRQPIDEVVAAAAGVPVLVDAAASAPVEALPAAPWALAAASPRKWGSLPGCGVLVVRRGTRWRNPWPGDDSPSDRDLGSVDIPAAVAAAASLRAVRATQGPDVERMRSLTSHIREQVTTLIPDTQVVGHPEERAAHIVTFSSLYVDGEALLHELNRESFAVSSGSACTSSQLRPSHVLEAMGALSHGNIRVSLHPGVTQEEVDRFLAVTAESVRRLRIEAGVDEL